MVQKLFLMFPSAIKEFAGIKLSIKKQKVYNVVYSVMSRINMEKKQQKEAIHMILGGKDNFFVLSGMAWKVRLKINQMNKYTLRNRQKENNSQIYNTWDKPFGVWDNLSTKYYPLRDYDDIVVLLELFGQLYYIQFLIKECQKNFEKYMNLRHKKPLNSYRGQANNDKNEFNDDDFKHQLSSAKKFNNPSGEQMYKYSKILTKFIMNANQYYRESLKNGKKAKTDIENGLQEVKTTRDQSRDLRAHKRGEQLKQKRKYMPKIQNGKLQYSQQKSKQYYKPNGHYKYNKQPISVDSEKMSSEKPNLRQKNNIYSQKKPNQEKQMKPQSNVQPPNMMNFANQQMYMRPEDMMKMYGNSMANCWNPQYLKMATMMQHMKNLGPNQFDPNFLNQMFNINPGLFMNPFYQKNPSIFPNPSLISNNAPIYNLTQVYLNKKQPLFDRDKQNNQPNKIVKRSNFHIGIAYYIYMSQLQKKGVNRADIALMDPTKASREIKQKETQKKGKQRKKK